MTLHIFLSVGAVAPQQAWLSEHKRGLDLDGQRLAVTLGTAVFFLSLSASLAHSVSRIADKDPVM